LLRNDFNQYNFLPWGISQSALRRLSSVARQHHQQTDKYLVSGCDNPEAKFTCVAHCSCSTISREDTYQPELHVGNVPHNDMKKFVFRYDCASLLLLFGVAFCDDMASIGSISSEYSFH